MSDKFNQLIELLIAEDQDKAKELFHEIVVERSRSIYESLIDEEEVVDEAEEEVAEDEDLEEELDLDESDFDEDLGGDAADDMIDDIEADEQGLSMEAEEDDEDIEDRVVDLEDALDELKAEFERMMSDEEGDMDDEGDMEMDMDMDDEGDMEMDDEDEEDEMEESVVREYTEKAPAPVTGEESGVNKQSLKQPTPGVSSAAKPVMSSGDAKGGTVKQPNKQTDAMDTREAGKSGMKKA